MKKLLSALLAGLLVTAMAACGNNDGSKKLEDNAAQGIIKIGVFEPASGDNGAGGKQETLGIQYANAQTPTVEIDGKEYKVELVFADNGSSNDKAPTAAQTLVAEGCNVILGSYGSGVSIAAAKVFEKASVPAIGVTCTNPQVTEGNPHYFRICFLDPFQGTKLAEFADSQFGAKKALVLTKLGDDYSTGLGFNFVEAFKKLGGEVLEKSFPDGTDDFSSYISTAVSEGCDVIFAPTSIEAAQLIIDQVSKNGVDIPLLAGDTWDSNMVLNAAKDKNVSIYVTTFYQEGGDPAFDEGIKAWIESDKTNLENNGGDTMVAAVSAMGNDAYYVALEAIKNANSYKRDDITNALPKVSYEGVSGKIEFNETGDANRNEAFVKKANNAEGIWEFVCKV